MAQSKESRWWRLEQRRLALPEWLARQAWQLVWQRQAFSRLVLRPVWQLVWRPVLQQQAWQQWSLV